MMKSGTNFLYGRFHNTMEEHNAYNSHWALKFCLLSYFMIAMLTAHVMLNQLEYHWINVKKSGCTVCGRKKYHVY